MINFNSTILLLEKSPVKFYDKKVGDNIFYLHESDDAL